MRVFRKLHVLLICSYDNFVILLKQYTEEAQNWSLFDKFCAKVVWGLKFRHGLYNFGRHLNVLNKLLKNGLMADLPYTGFELLENEWPCSKD